MRSTWTIPVVLLVSLFLISIVLAAPNASSIDWWVIGSGGGSDTASDASLSGILGQWAAGSDAVGGAQLCSGFWCDRGEWAEWFRIYLPLILRNSH